MTAPEASAASAPAFRSPAFLLGHIRHTLSFYDGRCIDPSGGFFHFFKDDGTVYDKTTRHLVSSTRFVFNHAMAYRRFGEQRYQDAARHGLRFLQQAHRQPQGGYAWQLAWDGQRAHVQDATNHCYGLAFVLLAHAHAAMVGIDEARAGIDDTFALMERHFWEPAHQLYADEATPDWQLSAYRGQNANMHGCEAMMAAFDATRDDRYLQRALALANAVTQGLAALSDAGDAGSGNEKSSDGRLVWEHYRADAGGTSSARSTGGTSGTSGTSGGPWSIDWDYNRHDKTNIFRPWGFQTGHLTEWAKLLLQLEARLPPGRRPEWLLPTARRFFDTAMRRGWDDAHGGLVYGFAPDGAVCDADKYFWVQAESFAAAALLALRTGDESYWLSYERLWAYSWAHMIDHRHGAWYRIRTPDNRAYSDEKSPAGKTDYHTMGACYDVLRGLGA